MHVPGQGFHKVNLPLDQAGNSLIFAHFETRWHGALDDVAVFKIIGEEARFRGSNSLDYIFAANLKPGRYVSRGHFASFTSTFSGSYATLAASYGRGYFDKGIGYVGFSFGSGSEVHYGWARIRLEGEKRGRGFAIIDYAYADAGEPIRAGQTAETTVPVEGSLGLLALGAAGVVAWRQRRASPQNEATQRAGKTD